MRRRPEPVLVEGVPADRQWLVHADRLACDLGAVLEDRQVGREVGRHAGLEAGRLEVEVLDQQQVLGADVLDGQRLALRDHQPLLVAEARRDGGGHEEQDQAEVREQRRELRVLVPVAIEVGRAVGGGLLADMEPSTADGARERRAADARQRGAIGQPRIEERLGLGDPHRGHVAPQPWRAIERAYDDRHDQDHEPDPEDRRLEDREGAEPLQHVDQPRTEDRVVADVDLLDRRGVVAR